ncbi:hypothetical protein CP533_6640 [Ophiocordyceps camponoti-saundersi (nom. inval.)]|nr:hypothetical protein CP533_6640 [Ophiocordyceps camponoti-saundersi (nom. inval.)]
MATPTIHVAATAPINPPGADPVLNEAQVWDGLQRKVRRADEFVPLISSCVVVEESANVVKRKVVFTAGEAVTEVCTEYAPSRVHFRMDTGTEVQNIISRDVKNGTLFMTYAFSWVGCGEDMREKKQEEASIAVTKSIEAMRAMVLDGRIRAA